MTRSLSKVFPKPKPTAGKRKTMVKDVDITSYETGGEDLTPADMDLRTIDDIEVIGAEDNGLVFDYDFTNHKLIAKRPTQDHQHVAMQTTGTSETPGEHQSAQDGAGNATGAAVGVSTAGQAGENINTDQAGAGSAQEVAAGTNLGTVRVKATGL